MPATKKAPPKMTVTPEEVSQTMPERLDVQIGDMVAWYPPGTGVTSRFTPAIVTLVNGDGTLSVNGVFRNSTRFMCEQGNAVPHVSEEMRIEQQQRVCGCWDALPQTERRRKQLDDLTARLEKLEG